MSSLSSDSEFKELDDIIDFFKIILRAIAKPIHYKELSDHLVLDYADIKSLFHSFSDSEKLAFFKDQSKSFKVDTNGLVSCIEDDIIEAFTKLLKCSAPQHFLKVINTTEVAATYFSQASESEKFKFFRDRAQIFIIPNDGYVKLSEKPAKIYKKLFKKSKVQVSLFFKDILTSHGPVYFTWFLDYLEMSPHYKNIIARESDVELRLWRFFKSHSLDFIISDLGFVELPPHLKSKVKEDTFISMKEDEVVGFFVAKLVFFGCLLFPLLLKLLQESALDIRSFFANYCLNEIQEFFMTYSHVFVLPYKTVSLLCTFQHDGFIYFEDYKYPFEDQQEVIFFFLDSLKIESPKHYIYLSQMLEKSDIETDFKHAFVSSSNSVKHWFFKNNPDLFCIGNNGYVSLHSLFKLSDVGKLAVQHFAKKLQVFSTKNFWTLINSAAVSSKEFQNYFANFSPLDKFYFFKKFPSVFNVDFNGYVSCDVVPNVYLEVDVTNTLIKELELSQPIYFEKLCLSVENSSEVAREFFRTYSISQKYKFFKSKPMHFCIKPDSYVYLPNVNSELEDKMLNNGIKSEHALVNVAHTSTNVISKTNIVQYSPIIPYSDSSTGCTASTSACVSPGASGSHCGLAVTHSDFLPEGIAVTPTYVSSGANSMQCSPTKLLSNSLPANLEETLLLTGSGEKRVQCSPTISSCASSVVSIIEYDISEANSTQYSPSIPCSDSSPVNASTQLSSKANSEPNSSSVSHSASSSVNVVDVHEYDDLEATDSQHSPIVSSPDSPVIITDTSKYVSSKTSSAQSSPTVSFLDSSSASITDVDEYANLEASDSQYNSIVSSSDSSAVSTGTSIHVSSKASGVQNSSAVSYSDSSFSITDVHEYVDSEASDSQCSPIVSSSGSLESYTQSSVNITDTSKQSNCKADGIQNSPTVPHFDFSSIGITDIHECADSEVSDSQRSPVVSNSYSSSVSIMDTSKHLRSDTHGTPNISAVSCSDSSSVNLAIVHVNNEVNGTQCNSIMSGYDILHTNSVHAVSEASDHSDKSVITGINSDSPSTSIVDILTPVGSETNGKSYISTATYNANVVGKGVMKNKSTMLNLDAECSSANSNLNECTAFESEIDDARNGVDIMRQEDTSHAKEQNDDNVNELLTKEEVESSNIPKRENNSDCQTETHLLLKEFTFEEFTNDVSTTKLSMSISPSHNLPSDVDELEETHGIDQVIKSLTAILKAYKRVHFEKLCTYNEFSSTKFPNYFLVYSANEKYEFFKTREKYFSIDINGYVSIPRSTLSTSILSPDNVKSHQNQIISTPSIGSTANDEQNQAFTLQNVDDCDAEKLSMPCTNPDNVSSNAEDALNNGLLSSQSNESDFNSSNDNEQLSVKEDDIIMLLKHHLNVYKRMNCLELCEATKQYFTAYSALQKIQFFKDRQQHFCIDNDSYVTLPSDTATQCKSYIPVKSSKDILCGLSSNEDNAVPCDQELPDTSRACISNIALSIEEADIIDVLKRNLKLCNRIHYLELFSCVEKLNRDVFACLFSFQKLNFFKRYPNHFHVSADNYVSLSESSESSLNSMSIVKDTSIIPFECKHTSDNDLTTIRSDSYLTSGSERCLNNIAHTNSTEEIDEESKGNSIDTLQHNTVRSLTGHRREIIKTLFDQLKSGKQMHFTQLCKVAEKLNGIVKKFFDSFADNEKLEFLMSYPQYFSVDSNGFVTLSKTMKSKVGSFLPCEESLKTCSPNIHISKDVHSRPVNHNNKISSMCLTPHNEQSLSSSFQWNSEEEKSVSALTTYTSVTAKGISEHPNIKDFLNFFQSILHTADVLHYEELYIELEDSNQFENYKTFFERYGKLKFFEDHSDIFKVYSGGFISLVAEADPKSCPIKDVYAKTTCKETGLVSDNEMNKSFDYTCAYEELSLSHCHMFTIRYFIKALREDQPLHFKQLVKDACIANPDAKSFFILFKTSADLLDFYKLHSMYFTIDDEEMVSLKKSDIMPDEVFSLEMELRNIKSSIISKALEFYVTVLKSRENLSVKESENLLQFTSGYVISFFNTNYPGSKIMNFFIDHPDCFLLDDEGKITLRTHEADVGIALENTCVKYTTIENNSVTNNITESDVSSKFENGGLLKVEKGNEFPPGTQDHAEASLKLPFNEVPSKAQKNTEISSKVWEIVKPLPIVQNDNNGSSKEHSNITKTTDRFSSQSVTSLLPQFVESTSSKDRDQLQENFSDAGCHDIKTTPSQHPPESFLKVPILNHHNDNLKSQGLQLDKDFEFKNKLNDGNYSDHIHRNEKTNADIIVQRRFSESALDLQYLNSVNIARNQHSRQNKVEQQPNASQPKTKPQPCNVDVQNFNAEINLPHQPPVRDALKQLAIIAKTYNPKLEMQCINFFKSIMQEKAPRILHVKFLRAIASKSPNVIRPYLLHYCQRDFSLFFYLHLDHFLINRLGYVALRITSNRTGCDDKLEIKAANFFTPLIHFVFKGKVSCDVLERCLHFASEEVQLYLERTYKTNLKLFFYNNVDHFDIDIFDVVSLKN